MEWPPNATQPITIVARTTDDRELAVVQLWVDGTMMTECSPAGPDRTTMECTLDEVLAPGDNYAYWALAYDTAGNGASSEIVYLHVLGT